LINISYFFLDGFTDVQYKAAMQKKEVVPQVALRNRRLHVWLKKTAAEEGRAICRVLEDILVAARGGVAWKPKRKGLSE